MDDILADQTPMNTPVGGEFNNEQTVFVDEDEDDEPRVDVTAEIKKQMAVIGAQMHNRGYESGRNDRQEEELLVGLVGGVVGTIGLGIVAYICYRQFLSKEPGQSSD